MARLNITQTTEVEVSCVATTPTTVLQLLAPTNQRVAVKTVTISFDGISNTAEPVIIRVLRQTSAGVGGAARNPLKKDNDIATAVQSTGQRGTFTTEPTSGDIELTYHIHPQAGVQYPLPLGDEIILAGGGRLGVQVTAPATVNALVTIEAEE